MAASVTWGATGGVVSSSGLYTAGLVPGGYVASASSSGITGIALLAVSDVSVASVAVSPASAAVSVGSTQQLSAVVKDANGNVLTGRTITVDVGSSSVDEHGCGGTEDSDRHQHADQRARSRRDPVAIPDADHRSSCYRKSIAVWTELRSPAANAAERK